MRILYSLLITCILTSVSGQVRQERDYEKSFVSGAHTSVEVSSKYGEVIVQTWGVDSVRFEVTVKAEGKNSSAVEKSMNKVDIRFRKIGELISATTEVNRGSGLINNLMNEVEGVVGNNKLKVNYTIWMPEGVSLSVENKFGDVYLTNLSGELDLEVSHGDIKADQITGNLNLDHSFGKSSFRVLNSAKMKLRGVDLSIDEAGILKVESGSSEMVMGKVEAVEFSSRNDQIDIASINDIICRGSFTDLVVDDMIGSSELDFSYGDIYFRRIDKNFKSMDISGKSADIDLVMNQASYIKATIRGEEDRMILPNSMMLMQKEVLDDGRSIRLSGEVGNTNATYGKLNIEAEGGKLIIAIKDTPIFSDRD